MSLTPITDRAESRQAVEVLRARMSQGADLFPQHWVGWRGGSRQCDVHWHDQEGIWGIFEQPRKLNHFWICFGVENPSGQPLLSITAEMNPPLSGINRRCAGAFLRDAQGQVYIAHDGNVRGGKKGVGKSAFLEFYQAGNWQTVYWPDGQESDMTVIGRIDGLHLPAQIAQFVREVARFKEWVRSGGAGASLKPTKQPTFTPEFSGTRTYPLGGEVESRCLHGTVVAALAKELGAGKYNVGNDRHRDLYIAGRQGYAKVLFEVKTDLSTTSLYEAVGQLMLHGAAQRPAPKLVAVLPGMPSKKTRTMLGRLGVRVLVYDWVKDQVGFRKLHHALS